MMVWIVLHLTAIGLFLRFVAKRKSDRSVDTLASSKEELFIPQSYDRIFTL